MIYEYIAIHMHKINCNQKLIKKYYDTKYWHNQKTQSFASEIKVLNNKHNVFIMYISLVSYHWFLPMQEMWIESPIRKARSSHSQILHQT